MTNTGITIEHILKARDRIAGRIVDTAMVESASLSERMGAPVHLKLEHRQITGSFKLRGATNAVALLTQEERRHGVVTVSTGNHGRALAYAASRQGIRAVICMSQLVPANKVSEIRRLGAEVRIIGESQDEAQVEAERLAAEEGLTMVPPFDHAAVVAGQGTLGLEIVDAVPDVETVVVPVSGGGLAAGVAAAVKSRKPGVRLIGVSMARGAAMKASLDAGRPVLVRELPTLADSLGGGIGLDNRYTLPMCRDLLDDLILVTEEEIAAGITHAYTSEREVVEGGGSVGIAAMLAGRIEARGPTVLIVSGRNIDMDMHRRVICGEQLLAGKEEA